jgi:hypothetical protein
MKSLFFVLILCTLWSCKSLNCGCPMSDATDEKKVERQEEAPSLVSTPYCAPSNSALRSLPAK